MSTVYSAWSAGWKPSGSDIYKKYCARLDWWVNWESATQINYGFAVYAVLNSSVNCRVWAVIDGNASTYVDFVFRESPNTQLVQTRSVTWNKGINASIQYINGYAASSSGKWTGVSYGCTATCDIPALAKYTVSFVMNGHGTQVSSQSIFYGYKATKPTDPTDAHYGFLGWYTDVACTVPFNFNTAITSNITLYAKWIKLYPTTRAKVNNVWYKGEFRCKMENQICDVVDGFTKVNGVWVPINRS